MSQLRKPLTAGAVDEYINHIKTRLSAGDNATQLQTQLTDFDSNSAGDVVKQRLNQVIETLKSTRALTSGAVTVSIDAAGTGYVIGDLIPVVGDVGDVDSVSIDAAGTGYVIGDELTILGDGNSATVEVASIGGSGEITGITITDGGSGYTSATVDASAVGNGDATLSATVNPISGVGCGITVASVGGSGEITSIEYSAGIGYITATPDTTGVGGEDATFNITVSNELNLIETVAANIQAAS